MPSSANKVLIITYYFPPSGGAGVQRTLKFVKYLRDFGWAPVVLTVRDADYPAYDETLYSEVPKGVKVYRSRIIEPYRLYRKFTGRGTEESTDIATQTLDAKSSRKLTERFSEWVRSVFFIPDARISWLFFAVRMGKWIIANEGIDVIYSSAPPYTTHLIGLKLKRYSGLPWVADFRDSWIGWVSAPQWRPAISRAIEKKMERRVLSESHRILTVSQGVKADLLSRHPECEDERWTLLPNGFDARDFEGISPESVENKIVITYLGSMYGARNPEFFIRALESLKKDGHAVIQQLLIRFVGRVGEPILQRIRNSTVADLIECIPYVPHKQSVAYLLGSKILLLIIDNSPANQGILTGKLFEYIGAAKPILALAPEGEAADLIRENNLGCVAPFDDTEKIKTALLKSIELTSDNSARDATALKKKFERREQTRILAGVLKDTLHAT